MRIKDQQLSTPTSTDDREDTEEDGESDGNASPESADTIESDDAAANSDAEWDSSHSRSDEYLDMIPIAWNKMPSS